MKKELGLADAGSPAAYAAATSIAALRHGRLPVFGEVRKQACSLKKGLEGCWECEEDCRRGLLQKIKPYGFRLYARRYGKTGAA